MTTTIAKLFQSGGGQAVRLPDSLRFDRDAVVVKRFGNGVLLPIDAPWLAMQKALEEFEPGFQLDRDQLGLDVRED